MRLVLRRKTRLPQVYYVAFIVLLVPAMNEPHACVTFSYGAELDLKGG
jgi:hypothetical protein